MIIIDYIKNSIMSGINILNGASVWLVASFILAGIMHDVLSPDRLQKMLGNKKISSLFKSTLSGMFLPICSCGVIPLGLSLYYSGAYLGPTLAFMCATPIINPIAMVMCFGLLGWKISIIYLITGFLLPLVVGIVANIFGGDEIKAYGVEENINNKTLNLEDDRTLKQKFISGLRWSMNDLALSVSKYVIPGMFIAGILLTLLPQQYIQMYLGNPSVISLGSITVLASCMYVCAVGHIPFIAALVASGAAPGVAITFLIAGTATNLPELISIYNIIGKRTVVIYTSTTVLFSLIIGYITNLVLMPNFSPILNFDRVSNSISVANKLIFSAPQPLKYLCSFIIFLFFIKSILPNLNKIFSKQKVEL
ncbi:efflux transporter SaoE [Tepidibacter sp.]|jgi:uncharacterized membrane protein YraQ (UPF0718 family)|uniref:efflux transporter SaoE n=1 Tax=Tepidibacter sp. TaxID=2529387 RepID=UPI002ED2FE0A